MSSTVNLYSLPTELLMDIASYLHASSSACLAFTTRRIYNDFDHAVFRNLKRDDIADYTKLLARLAKDRSCLSLCHFCICLHKEADTCIPSDAASSDDSVSVKIDSPVSDIFSSAAPSPRREKQTLLELRKSNIYPSMLQKRRTRGNNEQSIYVSYFAADTPRSIVCFISPENDSVFTATYSWAAEARIGRPALHFTQLIQMKLVLSKPLWSDDGFVNLRQALRAVDMHCCRHCPSGALDNEVTCKLSQILFKKKNGVCVQRESGYDCIDHRHTEDCDCEADVDVEVVGWCALVVKVWRGIGGEERAASKYERGSTKKVFEELA